MEEQSVKCPGRGFLLICFAIVCISLIGTARAGNEDGEILDLQETDIKEEADKVREEGYNLANVIMDKEKVDAEELPNNLRRDDRPLKEMERGKRKLKDDHKSRIKRWSTWNVKGPYDDLEIFQPRQNLKLFFFCRENPTAIYNARLLCPPQVLESAGITTTTTPTPLQKEKLHQMIDCAKFRVVYRFGRNQTERKEFRDLVKKVGAAGNKDELLEKLNIKYSSSYAKIISALSKMSGLECKYDSDPEAAVQRCREFLDLMKRPQGEIIPFEER